MSEPHAATKCIWWWWWWCLLTTAVSRLPASFASWLLSVCIADTIVRLCYQLTRHSSLPTGKQTSSRYVIRINNFNIILQSTYTYRWTNHLCLGDKWTWMADQHQQHLLQRHETYCQSLLARARVKLSTLVQVMCWPCSMMTRCISRRSSQWLVNHRHTPEHSTSTCTKYWSRHSMSSPQVHLATLHKHTWYDVLGKFDIFWFSFFRKICYYTVGDVLLVFWETDFEKFKHIKYEMIIFIFCNWNAQPPSVDSLMDETSRRLERAEQRKQRTGRSVTRTSRLRYFDADPCMALNISTATLNITLSGDRS